MNSLHEVEILWEVVKYRLYLSRFNSYPVYIRHSIVEAHGKRKVASEWKVYSLSMLHFTLNQQVNNNSDGLREPEQKGIGLECSPSLVPESKPWAMMALSLMARSDDVRLPESPAHSLYFMGTKWIDLWAVCMMFTQRAVQEDASDCLCLKLWKVI